MSITIEEGGLTIHHLVNQDADGPPIDFFAIAASSEHLWSKVLGCTTLGHGDIVFYECFTQAKIDDLDVAISINHDVFKFQITMDVTCLVQDTNANDYLGSIKFGLMLREATNFSENLIKFAAINEWHDKV